MYSIISLFIGILTILLGSFRVLPFVEWWFVYIILLVIGTSFGFIGYKRQKNILYIIPLLINICIILFLMIGTVFMNIYGGRP